MCRCSAGDLYKILKNAFCFVAFKASHNIAKDMCCQFYLLLVLLVAQTIAAPFAVAMKQDEVQGIQQPSTVPIRDLVMRRVPKLLPFLELRLVTQEASSDAHEFFSVRNASVSSVNITVTANSISALALGVHYYLKYVALRHISWGVSNLDTIKVPPPRPAVETLHQVVGATYRYSWNVCTHGYSMPWWNWERWELELDFMALQGVNLPLLFTGQEYVLTQVFTQEFNLTHADLVPFFSGPAFLPWQRMGNEAGLGGPLSAVYQLQAHQLQVKIMARAIELGMTPVLPCFGGNVPVAMAKHFPHADLKPYPAWNNYPNESMLLDPTDPLFTRVGQAFVSAQQQLYKAAGAWPPPGKRAPMFNCDVWMNDHHNFEPASPTASYLSRAGAAMIEQLTPVPGAVWLNQGGWMFHYPWWQKGRGVRVYNYLSEVPADKVLILELSAERGRGPTVFDLTYMPDGSPSQQNYWGRPWVWCLFANGGQRPGMYGNLTQVATDPAQAFARPNTTVAGIGITPEGIMNNPILWEFMFENAWRLPTGVRDIPAWVRSYTTRRYGAFASASNKSAARAAEALVQAALEELARTVYSTKNSPPHFALNNLPTRVVHSAPVSTEGPDSVMRLDSVAKGLGLARAWVNLTAALGLGESGLGNGALLQDIVDVGRGSLADYFEQVAVLFGIEWRRAANASAHSVTHADSSHAAGVLGAALLTCLRDLDAFLGTNDAFLLGKWLADARAAATSAHEADLFEFGARNQLMVWGPTPEVGPNQDYAAKHWQGLVGVYYHQRWRLFLEIANDTLAAGQSTLPHEKIANMLDAWAQNFSHQTVVGAGGDGILMNSTGAGKTLALSRRFLSVYNDVGDRALATYDKLTSSDIPLQICTLNFGAEIQSDLGRMAVLCDLHPRCVAFNSNGWLKSTANRNQIRKSTVDYYIKRA